LIKKYRSYKKPIKINKRVEERKRWRKFGECAGLPPGPEKVITSVSEEISFDLSKGNHSSDFISSFSVMVLIYYVLW